MNTKDAIVIGLGEVGKPLKNILSRRWEVAGVDITGSDEVDHAPILHVCYPYEIPDFVMTTVSYVQMFEPTSVVIHSTVLPGTTAKIQLEVPDTRVYYSPVRGKHAAMEEHMQTYAKFLAGTKDESDEVRHHMEEAGFVVELMDPFEALEMAKLLETTYFGVLVAWAQEVDRFARSVGSDYETVVRFVDEVPFLPSGYFPGAIGGHCVMPNVALLKSFFGKSSALQFVEQSNFQFIGDREF